MELGPGSHAILKNNGRKYHPSPGWARSSMVEHRPFKAGVLGSNPSALTILVWILPAIPATPVRRL